MAVSVFRLPRHPPFSIVHIHRCVLVLYYLRAFGAGPVEEYLQAEKVQDKNQLAGEGNKNRPHIEIRLVDELHRHAYHDDYLQRRHNGRNWIMGDDHSVSNGIEDNFMGLPTPLDVRGRRIPSKVVQLKQTTYVHRFDSYQERFYRSLLVRGAKYELLGSESSTTGREQRDFARGSHINFQQHG